MILWRYAKMKTFAIILSRTCETIMKTESLQHPWSLTSNQTGIEPSLVTYEPAASQDYVCSSQCLKRVLGFMLQDQPTIPVNTQLCAQLSQAKHKTNLTLRFAYSLQNKIITHLSCAISSGSILNTPEPILSGMAEPRHAERLITSSTHRESRSTYPQGRIQSYPTSPPTPECFT